jgi:hypothetical protein
MQMAPLRPLPPPPPPPRRPPLPTSPAMKILYSNPDHLLRSRWGPPQIWWTVWILTLVFVSKKIFVTVFVLRYTTPPRLPMDLSSSLQLFGVFFSVLRRIQSLWLCNRVWVVEPLIFM